MLAYYLEWHMRQCLAPMLFDDTDKDAAEALRPSVVAQAQRSPTAVTKQTTGLNRGRTASAQLPSSPGGSRDAGAQHRDDRYHAQPPLTVLTRPTPIQQKAIDLLGVTV